MSEADEQVERRARAYHEAGHAFALIDMGKRVLRVTIDESELEALRQSGLGLHEDEQGAVLFEGTLTATQEVVSAFAAIHAELRVRPRPDALPEFHGTARHELHVAIRRLIAAADRRAQQMLDAYWDDLERFAEELLREGAMEIRKDPEGQSEPA